MQLFTFLQFLATQTNSLPDHTKLLAILPTAGFRWLLATTPSMLVPSPSSSCIPITCSNHLAPTGIPAPTLHTPNATAHIPPPLCSLLLSWDQAPYRLFQLFRRLLAPPPTLPRLQPLSHSRSLPHHPHLFPPAQTPLLHQLGHKHLHQIPSLLSQTAPTHVTLNLPSLLSLPTSAALCPLSRC